MSARPQWPPADMKAPAGGGGRLAQLGRIGERTGAHDSTEPPEHRNDRRRFLIWACMLGAVPPQRVVERVVRDVEGEA
jgi:hypothetical protein